MNKNERAALRRENIARVAKAAINGSGERDDNFITLDSGSMEAFAAEQAAILEENAPEIADLFAEVESLSQKVAAARKLSKTARIKVDGFNEKFDAIPRAVAKDLGFPLTLLTGTGRISNTKVMKKLQKMKTPEAAKVWYDKIQKEANVYAAEVNSQIATLREVDSYHLTDDEETAMDNVDTLINEHNNRAKDLAAFHGQSASYTR